MSEYDEEKQTMLADHEDNSMNQNDALQVRTCRICLEDANEGDSVGYADGLKDDEGETLIAPCQCSGTSKWVHRQCLDQWRTYNQNEQAFSRCTECHFNFRFEPVSDDEDDARRRRCARAYYCLCVTKDIVSLMILVQLIVGIFGLIVWLCFRDENDQKIKWWTPGNRQETTKHNGTEDKYASSNADEDFCQSMTCQIFACYFVGFACLLILLGIRGCVTLGRHRCDFDQSIQSVDDQIQRYYDELAVSERQRSRTSTRAPTQQQIQRSSTIDAYASAEMSYLCCRTCNDCSIILCEMPGSDGDNDCCCCCCPDIGTGNASNQYSGGGGVDGEWVMLILVVVGIFFLLVGVVVGIFFVTLVLQHILQRHLKIIKKRQKVKEYRVQDLSYTLDRHAKQSFALPVSEKPLPYAQGQRVSKSINI